MTTTVYTSAEDAKSKTENDIELRVANAIGEAMMLAYYRIVSNKRKVSEKSITVETRENIEELFRELTEGECETASEWTAYLLATRYSNLFEQIFMIEGWETNTKSMVYSHHRMFVAKGINGKYYAGSPSNYQRKVDEKFLEPVDPLSHFIEKSSLEEVIEEVIFRYGGAWPLAKNITEMLRKEPSYITYPLNGSVVLTTFEETESNPPSRGVRSYVYSLSKDKKVLEKHPLNI